MRECKYNTFLTATLVWNFGKRDNEAEEKISGVEEASDQAHLCNQAFEKVMQSMAEPINDLENRGSCFVPKEVQLLLSGSSLFTCHGFPFFSSKITFTVKKFSQEVANQTTT